MALYLNTGTPGAGKTLWTLWTVEKRRVDGNAQLLADCLASGKPAADALVRDVYYHNIKIKKLPWIELKEVQEWHKLPKGSIIVFDECQESFPPRGTGSKIPEYVAELAKARHKGFDIYFITQHPSFVDSYVRKLPEFHNHLMRPFGASKAVVHSWKGVKDNCDKTRKDSITSSFGYPKEVYDWYESAQVHTHKFKMPWKVWALFTLPFFMAFCIYVAYGYFDKKMHPKPVEVKQSSEQKAAERQAMKGGFDPASYQPRIPDLPHTAPRYDKLTEPTVAPMIMGCMVFRGMCKCLTQQGTTHHATMQFCLATVENGLFQDFGGTSSGSKNDDEKSKRQPGQQPDIKQAGQPPSPAPAAVRPVPVAAADSGFNLPVRSVQDMHGERYTTAQSGALYRR